MAKVFVKPGRMPDGLPMKVRNPQVQGAPHFPEYGDEVDLDTWTKRRMRDGGLVLTTKEAVEAGRKIWAKADKAEAEALQAADRAIKLRRASKRFIVDPAEQEAADEAANAAAKEAEEKRKIADAAADRAREAMEAAAKESAPSPAPSPAPTGNQPSGNQPDADKVKGGNSDSKKGGK